MQTQFDVMPNSAALTELPTLQNFSDFHRDPWALPDFGGTTSDAGLLVNHHRALGHPPILQGVKILAGAMAQMQVQLMRRTVSASGRMSIEPVRAHFGGRVAKNRSLTREMSSGAVMTICQFRSAMMNHAVLAGDGWASIQRDGGGRPLQTVLLPPYPDTVVEFDKRQGMPKDQLKIHTTIRGANMQREEFWLDPIDVFQVQNLGPDGLSGYPLTELAANALGFGLGTHKYGGKSFANGAVLSGTLNDPDMPDDDQIRANTKRFVSSVGGLDNARRIPYLTGGTTFTPMSMSNIDAQLVEVLEADVKMQARILNIPPFLLGMTDSSGLKMAEAIAWFVQFTLGDWICNWTEQMRIKLLTEAEWSKGDLFFKFDVSSFLMTNWPEFVKTLVEANGGPVFTRPESRAFLQLDPDVDDSEFLERSTGSKPTQQVVEEAGKAGGSPSQRTSQSGLVEAIQKIYLGVGRVLSPDEARDILNREHGGNFRGDFEPWNPAAAGPPPGQQSNRMPAEQMENIARTYLLNASKGMAHMESQKVTSAAGESDPQQQINELYRPDGNLRGRLADVFRSEVVDRYCDDRKTEVLQLLERGGRSAVENDANNYAARGLKLCEMELNGKGNGHAHTKKE